MPQTRVTVVIPTLEAGETLANCVRSLEAQTIRDFDVIVVDNSGQGKASGIEAVCRAAQIIENRSNLGFGAAVNQGIRASSSPFIAVLNDDATAHTQWLETMLATAESRYEIGMVAPQIRLAGTGNLDSAGMLLCRDGSSKQRGHMEPPDSYPRRQQVLCPSGCAAMYRRDMLDEIGLFDERFFLYCEDTDLGLRARWKLWECVYVPDAIVEHRYSHSAGRASELKAFYVERNRLYLLIKNYPLKDLLISPFYSAARYFWHAAYLTRGQGKASEFTAGGGGLMNLAGCMVRARLAVLRELPSLLRDRRRIQGEGRMQPRQFGRMFATYGISPRRVAAL